MTLTTSEIAIGPLRLLLRAPVLTEPEPAATKRGPASANTTNTANAANTANTATTIFTIAHRRLGSDSPQSVIQAINATAGGPGWRAPDDVRWLIGEIMRLDRQLGDVAGLVTGGGVGDIVLSVDAGTIGLRRAGLLLNLDALVPAYALGLWLEKRRMAEAAAVYAQVDGPGDAHLAWGSAVAPVVVQLASGATLTVIDEVVAWRGDEPTMAVVGPPLTAVLLLQKMRKIGVAALGVVDSMPGHDAVLEHAGRVTMTVGMRRHLKTPPLAAEPPNSSNPTRPTQPTKPKHPKQP